jgi:hypothetical protein
MSRALEQNPIAKIKSASAQRLQTAARRGLAQERQRAAGILPAEEA